jgi:FKBP-type peptidyl-prolyl cis-trans isomerase FkpA
MKIFRTLGVLMVFALISQACSSSDIPGYKKTDSGLYYKFHVKEGGVKANLGDIITFDLVYTDEEGNVLMDTRGGYPSVMELIESEYPGDIYEGLAMLAVNDSVSFILDADQFFQITAKMPDVQDFVTPGSKLNIDVKMLKIQTLEQFELEYQELMEKQAQESDKAFQKEQADLLQYLKDNSINQEPLPSGLIYIETKKGNGAKADSGKEVSVHYTGMFMNGKVFDSSIERGEPISFPVGRGRVIPGWDEGIMLMNVGGKARLIIPSFLAYGDQGAGGVIPPFSTLIFEVELVSVK